MYFYVTSFITSKLYQQHLSKEKNLKRDFHYKGDPVWWLCLKATLKCEAVSQFKEVLLDYLKPDKKQYSGRGITGNKPALAENSLDDPTGLSSFPVSGESIEIMQFSVMPGHCNPSGQSTNITFVVTLYFRRSKYRPMKLDGALRLAWLLLFQQNEKQIQKKNQPQNMLEQRLNLKGCSMLYTITKNYIWSRNKDLDKSNSYTV